MYLNRKFLVIAGMAALVTTAVAFTKPAEDDHGFKNLKILPKDIPHEKLGKIMHEFNDALGVKCDFCHARPADTSNHHLDFVSDAKPEKEIARSMMKMTLKINKKYFQAKSPEFGGEALNVNCMTCHHGKAFPEEEKKEEKK